MRHSGLWFAVMVITLLVSMSVIALRRLDLNLAFVSISGEITEAERVDLSRLIVEHKDEIDGPADIKRIISQVRWIHHVDVARAWPDSLAVTVVTERPIAYWNDEDFINDEGKVFFSPYVVGGELAQLHGPAGTEREAMQQYQQLNKVLLGSGLSIDTLVLDERSAWQFTTGNGITVLLGKDDVMERLQRFLIVMDDADLASRLAEVERIDTRYPNGMAVSWKNTARARNDLDIVKTEHTQRELRL
jgi:cell division protein FtsQ